MSEIVISVDAQVYRLSAVKKAAYRLGDRCVVNIEVLADGGIRVRLKAKSEATPLHAMEDEFRNELLDQDLRESIAQETEGVRKLLLAQAFSGLSSLNHAVADTEDFRDDPLGIGRSQVVKH